VPRFSPNPNAPCPTLLWVLHPNLSRLRNLRASLQEGWQVCRAGEAAKLQPPFEDLDMDDMGKDVRPKRPQFLVIFIATYYITYYNLYFHSILWVAAVVHPLFRVPNFDRHSSVASRKCRSTTGMPGTVRTWTAGPVPSCWINSGTLLRSEQRWISRYIKNRVYDIPLLDISSQILMNIPRSKQFLNTLKIWRFQGLVLDPHGSHTTHL
jgi:hypothetical protein